jgi:hypothetical protein
MHLSHLRHSVSFVFSVHVSVWRVDCGLNFKDGVVHGVGYAGMRAAFGIHDFLCCLVAVVV